MDSSNKSEPLRQILDYPGDRCFSYGQVAELIYLMHEFLEPLEYAAVMKRFFNEYDSTDWSKLQLVGEADTPILAGNALIEYYLEKALAKLRTPRIRARTLEILSRSPNASLEEAMLL